MITRKDTIHTIARGTSWQFRRIKFIRFRTPDEDPYDFGFDPHDDSNYTTEHYTLAYRRLIIKWIVKQ